MNKYPFGNIFRLCFFTMSIFWMYACIDPYPLSFDKENKVLVVEGMLTNDYANPDTIRIKYSIYRYENILIENVRAFDVYLYLQNSKQKVPLLTVRGDAYVPHPDFRINPSEKYTLNFSINTENGVQQYVSSPQQVVNTPPILNIYDKFNPESEAPEDAQQPVPANEIFVDFQDSPTEKNYYLWRYIHYEKLDVCTTCYGGIYNYLTSSCVQSRGVIYYDYSCLGDCYEIISNKKVNVMSDLAYNGRFVNGRRVAQIPYYSDNGCLVEIQQIGILPDAYVFYKNLEAQTQTNGGLADTPPTAIVGNIINTTNPDEKVVGYFSLATIQKKRHWIDRATTTGKRANLVGHTIIRDPNPLAPLATCKKSATRTPFQPEGWQ